MKHAQQRAQNNGRKLRKLANCLCTFKDSMELVTCEKRLPSPFEFKKGQSVTEVENSTRFWLAGVLAVYGDKQMMMIGERPYRTGSVDRKRTGECKEEVEDAEVRVKVTKSRLPHVAEDYDGYTYGDLEQSYTVVMLETTFVGGDETLVLAAETEYRAIALESGMPLLDGSRYNETMMDIRITLPTPQEMETRRIPMIRPLLGVVEKDGIVHLEWATPDTRVSVYGYHEL